MLANGNRKRVRKEVIPFSERLTAKVLEVFKNEVITIWVDNDNNLLSVDTPANFTTLIKVK